MAKKHEATETESTRMNPGNQTRLACVNASPKPFWQIP